MEGVYALKPNLPDIMEISQEWATEEDGEPFGIGVTLACLRQAGKQPKQSNC